MGIDRRLDKADLLGERVWLEEGVSVSPREIARGPRIGIDYAEKWVMKPWRFWIRDLSAEQNEAPPIASSSARVLESSGPTISVSEGTPTINNIPTVP